MGVDAGGIVLALAAASLAVNGFFLRAAARDLRDFGKRLTLVEKNEAVQEWRLHHIEQGMAE